jgi:hypothetical protein
MKNKEAWGMDSTQRRSCKNKKENRSLNELREKQT